MADEEPGATAETEAESPDTSGGAGAKKRLPLPALIGIVIAVQALLSFLILSTTVAPKLRSAPVAGSEAHAAGQEDAKHHEEPGEIISLEPMVMNLATLEGEKPSFAKIGLAVEFAAAKKSGGHGGGGMTARLPLVRDAVITTVSSRTMSDVTNPHGKERLRRELLEQISQALGGEVRNIYFTNFVIQ